MIQLTEEQQRPKWDTSGLKEACQRGLAMGRERQEFDLRLLLDMLLEIERLESLLDSDSPAAEVNEWRTVAEKYQALVARTEIDAATSMRDKCVYELGVMKAEDEAAGTYPQGRGIYASIAKRLESLTLEPLEPEKQK